MDDWKTADANGVGFHIFGYGAWYQETLEYLGTTKGGIPFRCIQPDSAQQNSLSWKTVRQPMQATVYNSGIRSNSSRDGD